MKQKFSVLAVDLIVLILFSVIVFVVPIPKSGVFWLSYIFAVLAIVALPGFAYVAFQDGTSARSKFYGFPIFRVGFVYFVVQLCLSVVFMLLGNLVALWIPFLLYVVALGVAAIGLIANDNVRDAVHMVEEKQADSTYAMRMLRRNADALKVTYPELESFAEQLHYSDPVSTQATEYFEQQLQTMLQGYQQQPDQAARLRVRDHMLSVLEQRNVVCKSSKTR